jgi:hypothetical protein
MKMTNYIGASEAHMDGHRVQSVVTGTIYKRLGSDYNHIAYAVEIEKYGMWIILD